MRAKLLLGTALALLPLVGASAETIEETMIKAYMTNPTLAAERAQLRVTDENLPQALALRRPTVTGQGDLGVAYEDQNVAGIDNNGILGPRDASNWSPSTRFTVPSSVLRSKPSYSNKA